MVCSSIIVYVIVCVNSVTARLCRQPALGSPTVHLGVDALEIGSNDSDLAPTLSGDESVEDASSPVAAASSPGSSTSHRFSPMCITCMNICVCVCVYTCIVLYCIERDTHTHTRVDIFVPTSSHAGRVLCGRSRWTVAVAAHYARRPAQSSPRG
jgi:hypothetical protein